MLVLCAIEWPSLLLEAFQDRLSVSCQASQRRPGCEMRHNPPSLVRADALEHTQCPQRAQDFRSLLAHLGTRSRVTFEVVGEEGSARFEQLSELDALQAEALRLLQL